MSARAGRVVVAVIAGLVLPATLGSWPVLASPEQGVPSADGVPAGRFNVSAQHSPTIEHMLAGQGTTPPRAATATSRLKGVDVSSVNHPKGAAIDWAKVAAAGYKFAFVKATEGSYYVNPYYAADTAGARRAGMFAAAYHFAIPNDSSATLQADLALNAAGDLTAGDRTLPLILDAEYDPYVSSDHTNYCYGLSVTAMVTWLQAFSAEVARRTGQPPVIYTTSGWWNLCTANSAALSSSPLWIASKGTSPTIASGWTQWTYWQVTSSAKVAGISSNTDVSYFNPATLAVAAPAPRSDASGSTASIRVRSLNATAGQSLTYQATGLPSGIAIGPASGLISGKLPGTAAAYLATITVSGPLAIQQAVPMPMLVHGPTRLVWPGRQASVAGSAVDLQLHAPDGLAGCSLTFMASGLPPGLAIGTCGQVTGWPERPGSYQAVVRAGDSAHPVLASTPLQWTVTAAPVAATGQIRLGLASKCLISPSAVGKAPRIWTCGGASWDIARNGTIALGGKCLAAVTTSGGSSVAALQPCTSGVTQIWHQASDGSVRNASAPLCLTDPGASTVNGTAVTLATCAGILRQAWTLPAGLLGAGVSGCLAAIAPGSGHPAWIGVGRCIATAGHAWSVSSGGTISTGGRCLSTEPAPSAGTPVTPAACAAASPLQHWQALPGAGGTMLVNAAAGLCLTAGPSPATGPPDLAYCVAGDPRLAWQPS